MAADQPSPAEDEPVDPFTAEAPPEVADVRSGEQLDWAVIEDRLRTELVGVVPIGEPFEVQQFPNGAANLTYLLRFGETELVLRRPPFGTLAPGAHDMAREYRVLSRLWEHFEAAPRAYLFCDDATVAGADFFVMERRRGEVIRGVIPPSMRRHPDVGHRVGLALVAAMARLHQLDPEACGLGELGRPDGFVERQVRGWKKRWDLVADERHDHAMSTVHQALVEDLPTPQKVALVHNDLKLDNAMIDPDDPDRVVALFDWDMTTLGDPLVDLGTLLNYWPDATDPPDAGRASHDGMTRMGLPTRAEVVEHYQAVSGLSVDSIDWYEAFALWKTAVVIQQLHHRWKVGDSTDERMETIADKVPTLVATAAELLA